MAILKSHKQPFFLCASSSSENIEHFQVEHRPCNRRSSCCPLASHRVNVAGFPAFPDGRHRRVITYFTPKGSKRYFKMTLMSLVSVLNLCQSQSSILKFEAYKSRFHWLYCTYVRYFKASFFSEH